MKKNVILFCFFFSALAAEDLFFEDAPEEQFKYLGEIAMESTLFSGYRIPLEENKTYAFHFCKDCFPRGIVRVMKNGSNIIGFFSLHRHIDEENGTWINLLTHLFLKSEYIGQGYGRLLFQEAMRTAREELHWEALLWESFPKAAGFYKKMGAKQVGEMACSLNPEYRSQLLVYLLD